MSLGSARRVRLGLDAELGSSRGTHASTRAGSTAEAAVWGWGRVSRSNWLCHPRSGERRAADTKARVEERATRHPARQLPSPFSNVSYNAIPAVRGWGLATRGHVLRSESLGMYLFPRWNRNERRNRECCLAFTVHKSERACALMLATHRGHGLTSPHPRHCPPHHQLRTRTPPVTHWSHRQQLPRGCLTRHASRQSR